MAKTRDVSAGGASQVRNSIHAAFRVGRSISRSKLAGKAVKRPDPLSGPAILVCWCWQRLKIKPLGERINDLEIGKWLRLGEATAAFEHADLPEVAARLRAAKDTGAARILSMGAHVLRSGEFGLWKETGELNDWIVEAAREGYGLGENVGRRIAGNDYPYRDWSVFAAAYRLNVPVTVHVGIGYDILHEHPNCDGAALGAASYRDFLIFARTVERLESGCS